MLTPVPAAMIRDLKNLVRPEPIDQLEWFDDSANIAALLRWLNDAEPVGFDLAVQIVEEPWKWTPEWKEMRREQMSNDVVSGSLAMTQR